MSYRIGMYLRLSEDDENESGKSESNSISAQRAIIKEYIANHSALCDSKVIEFCDDGYSGVDFKRPSIQKLFEEVRKGTVNCIIVKDLSRFGRNHIEVGDYLEQIFPVLNVRFIAVNDRYDSIKNVGTAGMEVAFKNLMNENYSRDLSEKIRSVARINQSKGYFIGSVAPYRYKNINKELVVDEEAAKVVKRIFEMADTGMKYSIIAQILNKEGIYTAKEQRLGRKIGCLWEGGRISHILHDKVYIGTLISNKTRNYAPNKSAKMPTEEYLIFENHHEPIISKELFEQVSRRFYTTEKVNKKTYDTDLTRKVICGGCGKSLTKRFSKSNGEKRTFFCNYKLTPICREQKTDVSKLRETLLKALDTYISLAVDNLSSYKQKIRDNESITKDRLQNIENEVVKAEQRKLILYTEYKDGLLSKTDFLSKREKTEKKIEELLKQRNILQMNCSASENSIEAERLITEYKSNKLTNEMLIEKYLKKVIVYSDDRIEIIWNFEDVFRFE